MRVTGLEFQNAMVEFVSVGRIEVPKQVHHDGLVLRRLPASGDGQQESDCGQIQPTITHDAMITDASQYLISGRAEPAG